MSIPEWKRRSMVALAQKRLPILPGDYIFFNVSGARMLITTAMACEPMDNQARGEPTLGQWVMGLMWDPMKGSSLGNFWLDWSGFEDFWSIERNAV